MPPSLFFTLWTVAGRMGWSETKAKWRIPKWQINTYMHCHLFEQGAKVLTRKTDEGLKKTMEAMMKKLDQLSRKNP